MEAEYKINIFSVMQTSTPSGRISEDGEPAGDTIQKMILDHWDQYEKITIHFEGVVKMTRPFMDEAFAKVLENHSLNDFNQKLYFPDASADIVKDLNGAVKLRMKIIQTTREREDEQADGL